MKRVKEFKLLEYLVNYVIYCPKQFIINDRSKYQTIILN